MGRRTRAAPLQAFVQKFASTKPGAWFGARILHHSDRLFLKLTGRRRTLTGIIAGLPVVTLTTTGAKSGLPRTVPLLCIRDPEDSKRFALIASNWGQRHYPAWYHNLKAHPQATGNIGGAVADYSAREAEGDEYQRFWGYAQATYLGFSLYAQRVGDQRHIPIMVMTPLEG